MVSGADGCNGAMVESSLFRPHDSPPGTGRPIGKVELGVAGDGFSYGFA